MIFVATSLNYNSRFVKQRLPWKIFLRNLVTPALCLYGRPLLSPRESDWQTTTVEPESISTTNWHIMGNQTWWDIITVKSLYTTHLVLMHSRRKSVKRLNEKEAFCWLVWKCTAHRGARTQRASGRALVIWSVRQLGLSSETQRGEVGDHVWGPPSCYCP